MNTGTQRFIHRTNTGWCVVKVVHEDGLVRVIAIAHYDGAGSKAQAIRRAGTNTVLPDLLSHGNTIVHDDDVMVVA